jgi:hypothetical protein
MKASAVAVVAVVVSAAVLMAGCGGGSGSSSSSTAPGGGAGTGGGVSGGPSKGAPKKATAPNAPAGSKVVACGERATEMAQLRATAVGCGAARATMQHWASTHACSLGKGSSRSSCSVGPFRCQAVRVDRGAAVSCAQQGGDVSFIAKARFLKKIGPG